MFLINNNDINITYIENLEYNELFTFDITEILLSIDSYVNNYFSRFSKDYYRYQQLKIDIIKIYKIKLQQLNYIVYIEDKYVDNFYDFVINITKFKQYYDKLFSCDIFKLSDILDLKFFDKLYNPHNRNCNNIILEIPKLLNELGYDIPHEYRIKYMLNGYRHHLSYMVDNNIEKIYKDLSFWYSNDNLKKFMLDNFNLLYLYQHIYFKKLLQYAIVKDFFIDYVNYIEPIINDNFKKDFKELYKDYLT